jgi:hypothetical protein
MLADSAGENAGRSKRFIGLLSPLCRLAAKLSGRSLSDDGDEAPPRPCSVADGESRLAAPTSRGASRPRDGFIRRGTDAADDIDDAELVEGVAMWRDCF